MLSEDAKAIVASNLTLANELRRLNLTAKKFNAGPDYSGEVLAIFKEIVSALDSKKSK